MKKITQTMTPRCVGRYLIDMPEDFVLNSQFSVTVEGVSIEIKPMTKPTFDARTQKREIELKAERLMGKPDQPTLKEIVPLKNSHGRVFDRSRDGGSNVLRKLELHGWRDGHAVLLAIDARDMSYARESDRAESDTRKTTTPEKLAHLLKMYERVRGRADNEVPSEQGVCVHNGFVLGPPTDEEEVLVSYHLKDSQDVFFSFETASNLREETNLLDRGKQIESGAADAHGHTVRKGRHDAHGIKYDEWLLTAQTTESVQGQLFTFEANSKLGNAKAPIIMITFHNGYRIPAAERTMEESAVLPEIKKATLSEAESIALWDAVIPTLRARPGAF